MVLNLKMSSENADFKAHWLHMNWGSNRTTFKNARNVWLTVGVKNDSRGDIVVMDQERKLQVLHISATTVPFIIACSL